VAARQRDLLVAADLDGACAEQRTRISRPSPARFGLRRRPLDLAGAIDEGVPAAGDQRGRVHVRFQSRWHAGYARMLLCGNAQADWAVTTRGREGQRLTAFACRRMHWPPEKEAT
jgi:hypothetical protein